MRDHPAAGEKPVIWVGSSKRALLKFPARVIRDMGAALSTAQYGGVDSAAKTWKGQGPGVLEIVEDFDRATYRAVYTVRFRVAIYVLHCFQKKSHKGGKVPKLEQALINLA